MGDAGRIDEAAVVVREFGIAAVETGVVEVGL
jgi:hypothetical protein